MSFRVVATYTTIPTRYNVLQESINSLLKQTYPLDTIYIGLPKKSRRLGIEYPPLPKSITNHCTIVHLEEDYGPVTKILGGLLAEEDPDTVIISFDDDTIIDPNFVKVMVDYHKLHQKACICATGALINKGFIPYWSIISSLVPFDNWKGFTGYSLKKHKNRADLVFGVGGVLYTRGMFPTNEHLYNDFLRHALSNDALFHNDDVLISAFLCKNKIERLIFTDIPSMLLCDGENALSMDFLKSGERTNESIRVAKKMGWFNEMEPMNLYETPVCRGLLTFILVIFGLIFVFLYYKQLIIMPDHMKRL